MSSGDVLLFFTDGVNEAVDHKELEFGEERIKTILSLAAPNGAQAVVDAICDAVRKFIGERPRRTTCTLVVVRKDLSGGTQVDGLKMSHFQAFE